MEGGSYIGIGCTKKGIECIRVGIADEGQDEQVYQSEMMAMPDVMSQEFQQTQMMIAEQMGEQAIRYDEIYYPRTDKRAIGKLPISLTPSPNSWQTVHLRGQHPPIPHFKAQGC